MAGRRIRLVAVCMLVLIALQCAVPALAEGPEALTAKSLDQVADWLWGASGSPNSVRNRFNALASDYSSKDAKIPALTDISDLKDGKTFSLFQKDEKMAMQAGSARFRLSGRITKNGKVDQLTLTIDAPGSVNDAYLSACDQLMRVTMLSLFDKLSDRDVRDATLTLAFDVRPFPNKGLGTKVSRKRRTVTTVIDNTSVTLTATARASGGIQFNVRLGKTASSGQKQRAGTINTRNRNLSQAITECTDLVSCMRDLEKQAVLSRPNWAAIQAISSQIGETLGVLEKLSDKLRTNSKSRAYALQLKNKCNSLKLLNNALISAANDKDNSTVDLKKLVNDMQEGAKTIYQSNAMLWQ